MKQHRPIRRRVFAGVGVLAGLILIALERSGSTGTTGAERWFWLVVGLLLIGIGTAELMAGREPSERL